MENENSRPNSASPRLLRWRLTQTVCLAFVALTAVGCPDNSPGSGKGDWQLAYSDWLQGIDVFFEDIGIGTGNFGPVIFYEWGTDPNTFGKRDIRSTRHSSREHSLRKSGSEIFDFRGAGNSGAGSSLTPYEQGFEAGLAQDDWFIFGFDDSWLTLSDGPILYRGGDIPIIEDLTFDAGFNDGKWTTYNDGYFEAYRSAILIGFQDGYNRGYQPDFLEFLTTDEHIEFLNGGYSDGYNDGFSEGRVFGAYDISENPPVTDGTKRLLRKSGGKVRVKSLTTQ